ncbi:hypothetical protein J437_LFUL001261 [Ladona fulva]|uniref:Peptidase A2 domain-containing protein n=1 Tax=Ladona fulva TaxID=123851 RepID=A0A8K0NRM9_LADFU|nr:hypothetical protein J437_LFUL001261 [Ladona fulva]
MIDHRLLSQFLAGLREDIGRFVLVRNPQAILEAEEFALLEEANARNYANKSRAPSDRVRKKQFGCKFGKRLDPDHTVGKELILAVTPEAGLMVEGRILSTTYRFLVDTGATVTIVHQRGFPFEHLRIRPYGNPIRSASGHSLSVIGQTVAPLVINRYNYPHDALIANLGNTTYDGILGLDFMKKYGCKLRLDNSVITMGNNQSVALEASNWAGSSVESGMGVSTPLSHLKGENHDMKAWEGEEETGDDNGEPEDWTHGSQVNTFTVIATFEIATSSKCSKLSDVTEEDIFGIEDSDCDDDLEDIYINTDVSDSDSDKEISVADDDAAMSIPGHPYEWTVEEVEPRSKFPIICNSGIKVEIVDCENVLEFFVIFVDNELCKMIANQRNNYTKQFINSNPNLKPQSRARHWVETNSN